MRLDDVPGVVVLFAGLWMWLAVAAAVAGF